MALSSETDPVETIRIILDDNTSGSDWSNTGSKPENIEKVEESPFRIKVKRPSGEESVYIWSPTEGSFEALGNDWETTYLDTEIIQVDVWTKKSQSQADNLATDVREIITSAHGNDNRANTAWQYIRPTTVSDVRGQKVSNQADHYVISTQFELHRSV